MKKISLILSVFGLYLIAQWPVRAIAAVKFAPYYALDVLEGVSLPNKGEGAMSLNLSNDLGLLASINENHSIIGFYELKYTGPGFRREEGEKFTDRTMDHVFVLRHQYNKFLEKYTLESQIDFMDEFKRTGANEVWGRGLYDFERIGLGFFLKRKYSELLSGEASIQFHAMNFQNYTDLLAEFHAGASDAESSTGKQNHMEIQADASAKYGPNRGTLEIILMNYSKQKVIVGNVQPDGSYYSGNLQSDSLITLGASREQKFWNKIFVVPSLTYKIKTSNQNYQLFTEATSSVPVQYEASYYNYSEIDLAFPTTLLLATKWEYFINLEWDWKSYGSRPPRDENGSFVSGTQGDDLFIWSSGFTFKPNPVTRTTVFYQYFGQTSNMKFEKYFPYNYGGHFVGINFNYSY
jgi:hypothetical protein